MKYMAYTGGDVVIYDVYKFNNTTIIESVALSNEELLRLHSLTTGVLNKGYALSAEAN